jgi:pimeloyl-ACP methyl ester carboxylesterase
MLVEPLDKYLSVNGFRLHYLDWGTEGKQAMLLLHGFTTLAHAWDFFAPAFRDRYHILAPDQRGHGDSQWAQDATYTTEDHLVDIAGFVDALKLENFVLVGHSMGGRNAIMYAACFPEKVARLILIDSRPDNDPVASEALGQLLTAIPDEINSVDELAPELKRLYPYLSSQMCLHLAHHGLREIDGAKFIPKYDLRMREQSARAGYGVSDLWLFFELITCPILIVRGAESPILSQKAAQRMCQVNANACLAEIEGASHMVPQENPAAFEEAVRSFLDSEG